MPICWFDADWSSRPPGRCNRLIESVIQPPHVRKHNSEDLVEREAKGWGLTNEQYKYESVQGKTGVSCTAILCDISVHHLHKYNLENVDGFGNLRDQTINARIIGPEGYP